MSVKIPKNNNKKQAAKPTAKDRSDKFTSKVGDLKKIDPKTIKNKFN